jgi:hypothetical protein
MRLAIATLTLACACGSANDAPQCTSSDSFDGSVGYWTRTDLPARGSVPARTCTEVVLYPAAKCVEACGQIPGTNYQLLLLTMCCAPQSPCAESMAVLTNGAQLATVDILSFAGSCENNRAQVSTRGTLSLTTTPDQAVQGSYDVDFGTLGHPRLTGTFRVAAQCSQPGCAL